MKTLILNERAHSFPCHSRSTTFTVTLDLDGVPGAIHKIEDAAKTILNECNYLVSALVDTSVKPGSKDVKIEILGAMDGFSGAFHQPEDHASYIRSGSCRSYIKDVTISADFLPLVAWRFRFNQMAEAGDVYIANIPEEVTD